MITKFFQIALVFLLFNSCRICYDDFAIAVLSIQYHGVDSSNTILVVQTDKTDYNAVIDTSSLGIIDSANNYTVEFMSPSSEYNYLIVLQETNHVDTLSNFIEIRGGKCNDLKGISYVFNGEVKSNQHIDVNM
ncbi:MAG: hypothetical protein H6578_01310 [Chitinophagales bacterium]|nr:hypothetical protein [Chitinophagales bacterium]